ncbi:hypothetical protein FQR65_LT06005 [Abscondita terminalis]|nr:hypothetical protein FQR65_LT06005 [Abscondita terminalis]
MKRGIWTETESISKKVSLVSRNPEPYGIPLVSAAAVGKRAPNDLVELAAEIQKADTFTHANACNKLQVIAQQIRFLQEQAQNILRETKLNEELHHVACNFVKVPGNIYHLYVKPDGQRYFSMLSPQEWTNCPHQNLGSFRLEQDQSWTPIQCIEQRNAEYMVVNKILGQNDQTINLFALQS